jgi:hypothetical protein
LQELTPIISADWEDCNSLIAKTKKIVKSYLNKKDRRVLCACDPNYAGSISKRIMVILRGEKNRRLYLKNNQKKL